MGVKSIKIKQVTQRFSNILCFVIRLGEVKMAENIGEYRMVHWSVVQLVLFSLVFLSVEKCLKSVCDIWKSVSVP